MQIHHRSIVPQKCSAYKGLMLKHRECVILLTGWSVISLQSKVFRQSLLKLRFCLIILNLCSVMDHALCCEEWLWTGMHDGAVYGEESHLKSLTHRGPVTDFNSLGPCDAIWRQRSGSTLVQVMAWCLTAPSHYLNQFWLISKVEWHSSKGKFTRYLSHQSLKLSVKLST